MLGSNFTEITREAWCTIPGRSTTQTFNENNKITKISYKFENEIMFEQNFNYDENGNCIEISCTSPNSND